MRLLVVEDNEPLADVLRETLHKADFTVDRAATLAEARDSVRAARYDAIILDLMLPDGEGLDLLRDLRRSAERTPVLILSARDRVEDRVRGLDLGADDYLPKPFDVGELLARLRALLRRPAAALSSRLSFGNLAIDEGDNEVTISDRRLDLPRRERALLRLLVRRAGKPVTRDAIEEALFGFDAEVGPNAIEVYIHRLRKRLAESSATVTIQTLRGQGYALVPFGSSP